MSEFNGLPFEIIDQILCEFVERLEKESRGIEDVVTASEPVLEISSYTELIRLRLISKTWSIAVIPFYFQTISIPNSKRAKIILDNWKDNLFSPYFRCPVQRLMIEEPWNLQEDGLPKDAERTSPSMSQLASIIGLLGSNLKTLNIDRRSCLSVSPDFIEAVKTIQGLKSLKISFKFCGREHGMYDPDSLLELISAIPTLENLSLDSGSFGHLNFTSPALSNLRYFCFGNDDEEFEGISSIIEKSKNTLKFIEINAWFEPSEGLQDVFEPVKDTLEGLFTRLFTKQVTKSVTDLSFPKLRVIKTGCYDDITSEIDWLQAPMLKNVRTIVQDAYSTKIYWGNALRAAGVNALKKVPNFKHIVCTANLDSKYREDSDFIHPDLFELFKSHGVQCHVSPNLTADEIMDLDLRLNGPMKYNLIAYRSIKHAQNYAMLECHAWHLQLLKNTYYRNLEAKIDRQFFN